MLIGCKGQSESVWLIPDDWRHAWEHAGGRILREAFESEDRGVSEPTLLEQYIPQPIPTPALAVVTHTHDEPGRRVSVLVPPPTRAPIRRRSR